jgi:hypothetical protein
MAVKLRTEPQEGIRQRFLPIIRSGNGMVFGFGCPPHEPDADLRGRFAAILPAGRA